MLFVRSIPVVNLFYRSIVLIGAAGSAEALFNTPIILIILGGYAYNEKRYA